MRRPRVLFLFLGSLFSVGCAGGGGGRLDAGARDGGAGVDASSIRDAGRDAGGGACPSGQHRCGGGCIDDLLNDPAVGCRFGCGEACPVPMDGRAACTASGQCSFACDPPFVQQGDRCVCMPQSCADLGWTCGAPDDGCGRPLDCGMCASGSCVDGSCQCDPDTREPNDSSSAAPVIASLTDNPDSSNTQTTLNLHVATDEDWLEYPVADNFDAGNPQIEVILDMIPSGSNYDLAAYYVCGAGGDASSCTTGTADNMLGHGCASSSGGNATETVRIATECATTDEGGTLFVRVSARSFGGACNPYRLAVSVN
ncbi:MAG: hypothetical protein IT378_03980 [Sandaracinaceae bacterium]|nr:hypothetical protein [Sandaracinaceae bacterium]